MDKLFEDKELLRRERPTMLTEQQRHEVYQELARNIVEAGCASPEEMEDLVEDLKVNFDHDGFTSATNLKENSDCEIKFDSDLVAQLENGSFLFTKKLTETVEQWVKAFDIQPTLKPKSEPYVIKSNNLFSYKVGDTVWITGVLKDRASYLIHKDPGHKGGTVVAYETFHKAIQLS